MNLKPVVNQKDLWDALLYEFEERIQFAQKQMEQADKTEELYRFQGELRALRSLTRLREKVNG